jgi:hypothetical protein
MDKEFGMQELYFVQLKSTYPIEIKGKSIAAGEVIAAFDKIQIANFNDIHREVTAQGGYQNRKLMVWNRTEGVNLIFTQGIFSKTQFGLMNNTRLVDISNNQIVRIAQRDELETDSEGKITLTHVPIDSWIFVYNKETGEKLTGLTFVDEKTLQTPLVYKDVIVDYEYGYDNGADVNFIGEDIFEGYVSLEGRSRIKDDITGETHTAIIYIPKLKITSDFNLTLGANAQPIVGKFTGVALSTGERKNSKALEIYFLDDDIDKDSEWR